MNVAIIGAGNVGSALALALTRAGHQVVISARTPEHARKVATATGAAAATSNLDAASATELVILAVPAASHEAVAAEISEAVRGKPVVDVSNRMSVGDAGPVIDNGPSNAERLATWLPDANVVKAFNTLFSSNQTDPFVDGVRLDGFVAADDADARSAVLALVESLGLRPIDAGPLSRAQQLEQLAFLNIALNMTNGWSWQSGWSLVGAPAATDRRAA